MVTPIHSAYRSEFLDLGAASPDDGSHEWLGNQDLDLKRCVCLSLLYWLHGIETALTHHKMSKALTYHNFFSKREI